MEEHLSWIVRTVTTLIVVSALICVGIYYRTQNNVSETVKVYAELTSLTGGFTHEQYKQFIEDLKGNGVDPEQTEINIKAISSEGVDISNKAINVTTPQEQPYPENPQFCPRGTKISIEVISKEKSLLSSFLSSIGVENDIRKVADKKVYMSERIE